MCVRLPLCLFVVIASGRVFAQPVDPPDTAADKLTGDWLGMRTSLQNAGINLRAHFTTESAANPSGGKYHTARYTQQIGFGIDFDLHRMLKIPDAAIQVTLTENAGRSLSADAIGNQFAVQELYGAGQNFRLAEMNYEQDLFSHKVTVELGWSPVGDHFAGLPAFCEFQNGVICGHANAMTTDSGAHNFPTAEWGARINMRPKVDFYVETGIYQVNPDEGDSDAGFNLSFRSTGMFLPIEVGWSRGRASGELPGDYKVGGYYNSSDTPDLLKDVNGISAGLSGAPFELHNGRSGAYLLADQMVFRERPGSNRGLTVGAMVTIGDSSTAKYRYSWMAGGHYQGTFRGRDKDVVSCMFAYVRTNSRLTQYQQDVNAVAPGSIGVQSFESIAEIDYGLQVKPWLRIRPNLQYIINPAGTGKIANAFVIGLYTQLTF
jgi:porin